MRVSRRFQCAGRKRADRHFPLAAPNRGASDNSVAWNIAVVSARGGRLPYNIVVRLEGIERRILGVPEIQSDSDAGDGGALLNGLERLVVYLQAEDASPSRSE